MMPEQPLVSIIVPTYNEEKDIARTLDALAALFYRPLEVIVVDKSRDRTPEIVLSYTGRIPGLRLIPQGDRPGVSAARNAGLRAARGEIVVILNADVFPDADFIDRILPHYHAGADYLLIQSQIVNTDQGVFPRYLQAQHEYKMAHYFEQEAGWTEGYSCRRELALSVGGFPEAFGRNSAGEDVIFGERMRPFRRAADLSIVVRHTAPVDFRTYWVQRLGRGRGGAYRLYAYEGRPLRWGAVARSVIGTLAIMMTLFPVLRYARWLTKFSSRGWRDILPFAWARMIEITARAIGYWDGCRDIARDRKALQSRGREADTFG